ncbi:MAG: TSUP family transporter, partial [Sulfitobacter sp.]
MISSEATPFVAVVLAGLVGGAVRGYSGFGFGMAAVPIAMLALPPVLAIPAVLIHEMIIGLFTAQKVRTDVAWHPFGWLFAGTLIGTPMGLG